MSFVVQPLINVVNSLGHSATSAVSTFLSLNHIVASNLVRLISAALDLLRTISLTVLLAVQILLEDLFVFLRETVESVISAFEVVFALVDGFFCGVFNVVAACKDLVLFVIGAVAGGMSQCWNNVMSAWSSMGDFFSLLGSSVVLLVNLVPRTLYMLSSAAVGLIHTSAISTMKALDSVSESFASAPLEMFVGLLTGLAIAYSTAKLASKLVRDHHLTPSLVLQTLLKALLFVYLNFVRGVLTTVCVVFYCVTTTLTHVHVPRFHHAGDSDVEEEEEDHEGVVVGQYDSSDNEENERQQEKWRNYNLLLQRREQKLKNRLNRKVGEEENVEEMLFEQVEREREDKLCVICQDREKCIMILPCRHLCICQECQVPLQEQGRNICPICRKNVRNTIKAYL